MPAPQALVFDLGQLGPHPLRDGLALQPEAPGLRLPAIMREAEEVERLGLADASRLAGPGGVAPELDEPRLVGMQFQTELRQPLAKVGEEPPSVTLMFEPGDKVISEAHDDHVTVGVATSPLPGPPVEDVVEVDVGEQRRGRCPLGAPRSRSPSTLRPRSLPRSPISGSVAGSACPRSGARGTSPASRDPSW